MKGKKKLFQCFLFRIICWSFCQKERNSCWTKLVHRWLMPDDWESFQDLIMQHREVKQWKKTMLPQIKWCNFWKIKCSKNAKKLHFVFKILMSANYLKPHVTMFEKYVLIANSIPKLMFFAQLNIRVAYQVRTAVQYPALLPNKWPNGLVTYGLKCCNQIGRILGSNPTRHLAVLSNTTLLRVSQ